MHRKKMNERKEGRREGFLIEEGEARSSGI